jgi:hypothetical protein
MILKNYEPGVGDAADAAVRLSVTLEDVPNLCLHISLPSTFHHGCLNCEKKAAANFNFCKVRPLRLNVKIYNNNSRTSRAILKKFACSNIQSTQ